MTWTRSWKTVFCSLASSRCEDGDRRTRAADWWTELFGPCLLSSAAAVEVETLGRGETAFEMGAVTSLVLACVSWLCKLWASLARSPHADGHPDHFLCATCVTLESEGAELRRVSRVNVSRWLPGRAHTHTAVARVAVLHTRKTTRMHHQSLLTLICANLFAKWMKVGNCIALHKPFQYALKTSWN